MDTNVMAMINASKPVNGTGVCQRVPTGQRVRLCEISRIVSKAVALAKYLDLRDIPRENPQLAASQVVLLCRNTDQSVQIGWPQVWSRLEDLLRIHFLRTQSPSSTELQDILVCAAVCALQTSFYSSTPVQEFSRKAAACESFLPVLAEIQLMLAKLNHRFLPEVCSLVVSTDHENRTEEECSALIGKHRLYDFNEICVNLLHATSLEPESPPTVHSVYEFTGALRFFHHCYPVRHDMGHIMRHLLPAAINAINAIDIDRIGAWDPLDTDQAVIALQLSCRALQLCKGYGYEPIAIWLDYEIFPSLISVLRGLSALSNPLCNGWLKTLNKAITPLVFKTACFLTYRTVNSRMLKQLRALHDAGISDDGESGVVRTFLGLEVRAQKISLLLSEFDRLCNTLFCSSTKASLCSQCVLITLTQ
ncbi:hypothetical protein V5O48_001831 [Marasmius crinis-equi]|uniref:Uncharacterized protein n=1 Tax=Marasmius crinis-equi TaxID=585013 RepID=A0ABR3FY19_9AGAR